MDYKVEEEIEPGYLLVKTETEEGSEELALEKLTGRFALYQDYLDYGKEVFEPSIEKIKGFTETY